MEENEELEVQCPEEMSPSSDGAVNKEANATLSKEDILAASRKENKNGDERERQGMLTANSLAMSISLLVVAIVLIVSMFVKGEIPFEIMMIYTSILTTQSIVNAVKMSKLRVLYIFSGVTIGLGFIAFTVFWILELCGVAL